MITVAEVRRLALKHYNEGGDGVVECYMDSDIQLMIDEGYTTEAHWIRFFQMLNDYVIWD